MIAYLPPGRLHARNVWLRTVLGVVLVVIAPTVPWLSCLLLWFFLYWRSEAELGPLVGWIAVGLTWVLLSHIAKPVVAWGLVAGAIAETVGVCVRWWQGHRRPWGTFSPAASGHLLAIAFPFTLVAWPAVLIVAFGLTLTHSYLALIALAAGLVVLYGALPLVPVIGATVVLASPRGRLALDRWTPRGSSPDWRSRLVIWRLMAATLTWKGHGHGRLEAAIAGSAASLRRPLDPGPACCDPLQLLWEYGALGGLAMLVFLGQMLPRVTWGDPWSAAFIVGLVGACGYFPLRYAPIGVAWLAVVSHL